MVVVVVVLHGCMGGGVVAWVHGCMVVAVVAVVVHG